MTVDRDELRETMRLWTSGITIVTTAAGDRRAGVTVSSFTSVSLEPPLILVCLQKGITALEIIRDSRVFAVSLLRAGQSPISAQFAGFTPLPEGADRFYQIPTLTAITGVPILQDALAWLDCRVYTIVDGGGSEIVLGEVVATERRPDLQPLVYHNRGYYTLLPEPHGP